MPSDTPPKLCKETMQVIRELYDLFPTGDLYIGGSTARYICLEESVPTTSDIDVYLTVEICRHSFIKVLKEIVFKDTCVELVTEGGDTPGDHTSYKMPHIRRRIKAVFPGGEYPDFDFVFLSKAEVPCVSGWLLKYQASNLSECCVRPSWGSETWITKTSAAFINAFKRTSPVTLHTHEDYCTIEQAKKVYAFCKDRNLEVVNHTGRKQ